MSVCEFCGDAPTLTTDVVEDPEAVDLAGVAIKGTDDLLDVGRCVSLPDGVERTVLLRTYRCPSCRSLVDAHTFRRRPERVDS